MNHLEQLVSEWLEYSGYFVRISVPVGPRIAGGFEGELDVVGLNPAGRHLLHIECSLDSMSWAKRHEAFQAKFERGRKYIRDVFSGLDIPDRLDQVALLQYATTGTESVGGARLVTVREFIREILSGLEGKTPASGAVPSTLPLIRTLQLAADSERASSKNFRRVLVR